MKFGNIKTGDTVLIKTEVRIGWSGCKYFWQPKTVDKVTPKQFVIENRRYKKDDGYCIGGGYAEQAKLIGEEKDETNECNELVKKLNAAYKVKNIVDQFKISYESKNLFSILEKLKEAEKLLIDA